MPAGQHTAHAVHAVHVHVHTKKYRHRQHTHAFADLPCALRTRLITALYCQLDVCVKSVPTSTCTCTPIASLGSPLSALRVSRCAVDVYDSMSAAVAVSPPLLRPPAASGTSMYNELFRSCLPKPEPPPDEEGDDEEDGGERSGLLAGEDGSGSSSGSESESEGAGPGGGRQAGGKALGGADEESGEGVGVAVVCRNGGRPRRGRMRGVRACVCCRREPVTGWGCCVMSACTALPQPQRLPTTPPRTATPCCAAPAVAAPCLRLQALAGLQPAPFALHCRCWHCHAVWPPL